MKSMRLLNKKNISVNYYSLKFHFHLLIAVTFIISALSLNAAHVDTLTVHSPSMNKNISTCVITPLNYNNTGLPYPVLYLLHGYGGNYATYINFFPEVLQFADQYNMIIIGTDGGFSSWYLDSPVDPSMKYETYISKELVVFIDSAFNTVKSHEGRAITGLSMGGYGALYLAIRHQDIFGACGSMSGGVDFRPFYTNWDLTERLGAIERFPENWEKNTIIYQLSQVKDNRPEMIIDCGVDDFFIDVNRQLHEKMLKLNIKHDYIERPGEHTREYWSNALQYQFLYFADFFKKPRK
ncbi:MAG TPA: alpha/beta hydrolase family protein [Bacteroidales bacterium]|mgnify:CR=1 FL=1|nr:alpha/beta hydrolase family protein [Bacteroidales bacterium]